MNYGNIKYYATEDGVGCRTVLFVSGCRHHCKGCFQPQTWDFNYGEKFTDETKSEILNSLNNPYVNGLTLLGGEPFEPENQKELVSFVKQVKEQYPNKTIWAYSGCTFEELMTDDIYHTEYTTELLSYIDVLVDGLFIKCKKNLMLPYRGSENQRVIDVPATLKNWLNGKEDIVLSQYHHRNR